MLDNVIKFLSASWFLWVVKSLIIVSALLTAYLVRFDFAVPESYIQGFLGSLGGVLAIKLTVFWRFGLTHGWWRYVSIADVLTIFKANLLASLGFLLFAVFVRQMEGIPRSVVIMDGILCFLLICGVRFATRAFRENYFSGDRKSTLDVLNVLIVGAGDAGQMIAREVRQNARLQRKVVGFIDDDPRKLKQKFLGIPVLGPSVDIAPLSQHYRVDEIIIAIPSATSTQLRKLVTACEGTGIRFKTLPGVGALLSGGVTFSLIRDVNLEDLLGRKPVSLEASQIRNYLTGKCVLVTGAAGSIGSEICRQVARFSPERIVLFDHAETPLFFLENELAERFPDVHLSAIIGDVRDQERVESIFDEMLPQVVFHAAAYKHVPMMEYNPLEAISNNVFGTKLVADVAHRFGVSRFVMVSTDKAVHPTNVMGATKRVAELYVQSFPGPTQTRFITVRFGNVLGSAGSVVPIFSEQIRRDGPVTVTDPDVTRFFMTIPEASQLVLQAGSMGHGGEIFLLEMGEPVKIVKLAEDMIKLSGKVPYEDIDIVFSGLRAGEKLHEELLMDEEGVLPTDHHKIRVAKAAKSQFQDLASPLDRLRKAQQSNDINGAIKLLKELVPSFSPRDREQNLKRTDESRKPRLAAVSSLPAPETLQQQNSTSNRGSA